jgi:hypothetical protein
VIQLRRGGIEVAGLVSLASWLSRAAGEVQLRGWGLSLMSSYFAHITTPGRIASDQYPFTIGVMGAPDNFMPIGQASEAARDAEGSAAWSRTVHGVKAPGRWVLVDRWCGAVDGASA